MSWLLAPCRVNRWHLSVVSRHSIDSRLSSLPGRLAPSVMASHFLGPQCIQTAGKVVLKETGIAPRRANLILKGTNAWIEATENGQGFRRRIFCLSSVRILWVRL